MFFFSSLTEISPCVCVYLLVGIFHTVYIFTIMHTHKSWKQTKSSSKCAGVSEYRCVCVWYTTDSVWRWNLLFKVLTQYANYSCRKTKTFNRHNRAMPLTRIFYKSLRMKCDESMCLLVQANNIRCHYTTIIENRFLTWMVYKKKTIASTCVGLAYASEYFA